jgi:hypothetical protein
LFFRPDFFKKTLKIKGMNVVLKSLFLLLSVSFLTVPQELNLFADEGTGGNTDSKYTDKTKNGYLNLSSDKWQKMDPFAEVFNQNISVPAAFQSSLSGRTLTLDQMINLRNCFHGVKNFPCTAKAESLYPIQTPQCDEKGVCDGTQKKIEGCYFSNFKRAPGSDGEISSGGRCENPNTPFRVLVSSVTGCPDDSATCTRGAFIDVKIQIFDDQFPEGSVEFSKLSEVKSRVSALSSGDPLRVSCAMLAPDGYEWNESKGKCERPTKNICEMMKLPYVPGSTPNSPGKCMPQNVDCRLAFSDQPNICTQDDQYCKGIRYAANSAGGVPCLCTGTTTAIDKFGRACFDDTPGTQPKTFSTLLYEAPQAGEYKTTTPNDVYKRFSGELNTLAPGALEGLPSAWSP